MEIATVQETISQEIRKMIIEGRLKKGQRLKEDYLAKQFGTSRQPIRESLIRLSVEGIVENRPRVGFRVKEYTLQDCIELYELREVIEGLAARKAAINGTEEDLAELKEIYESQAFFSKSGQEGPEYNTVFHSLDEKFHRTILQMASTGRLNQFSKLLLNERLCLTDLIPKGDVPRSAPLESHERILNAILDRNPDDAEKYMRHHLSRALNRIMLHNSK